MIWTVTLNPAMDCYLFPERFEKGAINSYDRCCFRPGGKGVNVSLLLTSLGVENTALGIGAGASGREIEALLRQAGCKTDFLFLKEGASRVNLKIRTPEGEETDLNGAGPEISEEALERLGEKLFALQPGDGLVLAGSIPPSLPTGERAFYCGGRRRGSAACGFALPPIFGQAQSGGAGGAVRHGASGAVRCHRKRFGLTGKGRPECGGFSGRKGSAAGL